MGFLPGWSFRKSKTVNGTTFGSQTNYTLQLTVYKGSGTDTDTAIYLNNNCNNDFSDVRFTSLDGETLLDYYMSSINPGVSAVVDIEVDSIPVSPGSSTIYVYYGNTSATSQSNGDNTFLLFDYFGVIDSNKWEILNSNVVTLNYLGWLRVRFPSGMITTKNSIPLNCEIKYRASPGYTLSEVTKRDIKLAKEITQRNFCRYSVNANADFQRNTSEGSSQLFYTSGIHIIRHTLGGNWVLIVGGSVVQTQPSLRTSGDVLFLHFASTDDNMDVQYVIIRKYASPEPTFGSTGAEERPSAIIAGRTSFSSRGASISGGILAGKGKSRR